MVFLTHTHQVSFKHAFNGLVWAFKSQPNFQIHAVLSVLAILLGLLLHLSSTEWVLIIFTIFWGLAAEMVNTAIEAVCDLVTTEYRKEIKIAKDVAAGMMLLTALGAILVAGLVFIPKLLVLP